MNKISVWQRIAKTAGSLVNIFDPDNWLPGGKDAAFTLALVALSAKMAVADGVVSVSEVRAFRDMVVISERDLKQVERFFMLAQQDVAGYRSYARKVRKLFQNSPETLEHVLDALFSIAAADGVIHEGEFEYLKNVSDIFGFDEARFEQIAARFLINDNGVDPYLVLGLVPEATNSEIKRVYRRLVSEHHPDRLIAKGVPEELISIATARVAAINAAYDQIAKVRGI
ncbi:DnaJ-like protein DjlA [hydrothermal vent metagenome]|uniref:DnaJ-like protein DjlA n=1 Tax=hydrothermal vent metagenome TaxID=652676 RepID=A0A3B0TJF5_9ZZZZ